MLRQMAKLKRRAKLALDRPGGLSHKWPNSRGERSLLMLARVPGAEAPRHAGGMRHEALQGPLDAVVRHHHSRGILGRTLGHVAVGAIERGAVMHVGVSSPADHAVFRRRLREAVRRMTGRAGELARGHPIAPRLQQPVPGAVQFDLVVSHSLRRAGAAGFMD